MSDGQATGTATGHAALLPAARRRRARHHPGARPTRRSSSAPSRPAPAATRTFEVTEHRDRPDEPPRGVHRLRGRGLLGRAPSASSSAPGESAPVTRDVRAHGARGMPPPPSRWCRAATNRPLVSLVAHGYGGSAPGPGPDAGIVAAPLLRLRLPFDGRQGIPAERRAVRDRRPRRPVHGRAAASARATSASRTPTAPRTAESARRATCARRRRSGRSGVHRRHRLPSLVPRRTGCSADRALRCPSANPFDAHRDVRRRRRRALRPDRGHLHAIRTRPTTTIALAGTPAARRRSTRNGNTTGRTILGAHHRGHHASRVRPLRSPTPAVASTSPRRAACPSWATASATRAKGLVAIRKSNGGSQTLHAAHRRRRGPVRLRRHRQQHPPRGVRRRLAGLRQLRRRAVSGGCVHRRSSSSTRRTSRSVFRLHPDGSVVFATVRDGPTTATVSVYKVDARAGGRRPPARQRPAAVCHLPAPEQPPPGTTTSRSRIAGLAVSPAQPAARATAPSW